MSQTSEQNSIAAKHAVPKLINIIVGQAIALVILTVAVVALTVFVWKKKVETFAVSDSGQVIPMVSLDKPYLNDSRVGGFAEECLRTGFAHDFENFIMTMEQAKKCYTSDGARAFAVAMDPMLLDMKEKNLVMSSSLRPTVVVRSYKLGGVVHWETQTPMTLYRRGTREQLSPQSYLVTSVIQRVSLDENVRGVSLRSINLKPTQSN